MATSIGLSKALMNDLLGIYIDAENKMLDRLAKRAKRGATEPGWTEEKFDEVARLRKEIEAISKNTTKLAKTLSSKGIIDAYKYGVKSASTDLGTPLTIMKDLVPPHVQRLILETHGLIEGASVQILRNTEDAYRKIVAETSTNVLTGVDTRLQATQESLNRFAAAGITGFIDKAGRSWDMASYVEMAIRTATSRAALQGHIDRQSELGYDLIMVSSIGTTCPICSRWQGKILSISGKDYRYSSLESAQADGLFHPNCKHTIMAYYEGVEDTPKAIPARDNNTWLYEKTQEQRYNERNIRKWKRVEAVALNPFEAAKARKKILYWQQKQRDLIMDTGLKRNYGREGIRTRQGDPLKVTATARKPFDKPEPKDISSVKDKAKAVKKEPKTKESAELVSLKELAADASRGSELYLAIDERSTEYALYSKLIEIKKRKGLTEIKAWDAVLEDLKKGKPDLVDVEPMDYSSQLKRINKSDRPKSPFVDPTKFLTLEHLKETQEKFIKRNGIDLDDNKIKSAKAALEAAIDNGAYRMRVPDEDVLNQIMNTKFKNQMEVGDSRGSYNPRSRKEASHNMFGTDLDKATNADYEIYGYMGNKNVVEDALYTGSGPSQYGRVIVTFKPERVRGRVTMTVDDSLGPALSERIVPTLTDDIVPTAIKEYDVDRLGDMTKKFSPGKITPNKVIDETGVRYLELQYHGGLTMDDVESVTVKSFRQLNHVTNNYEDYGFSNDTINALKARGIKVQVIDKYDKLIEK